MAELPENPYIGPQPFQKEDRDRFKGRDREISELSSLIVANREVVFHSQSGAGKTSILHAGIYPRLEKRGFDILPPGRVIGADKAREQFAISPKNIYTFNLISSWIGKGIPIPGMDKMTVSEFLQSPGRPSKSKPRLRIVILDQFEELFTTYPDRWKDRVLFAEQIAEALEKDRRLRVLIAIRDEYLAQLLGIAKLFPGALRTRYHLKRLRDKAAREAIEIPAKSAHRPRSYTPHAIDLLVSNLSKTTVRIGDKDTKLIEEEFIEPVQLQIVCQKLWQDLPQNVSEIRSRQIEDYGDVNTALYKHYTDSVAEVSRQTLIPKYRLRRWFEKELITEAGTRGTVCRIGPKTGSLENKAVDALQKRYLVRAEQRGGADWYELTHDRFIEPVRIARQSAREKAQPVWIAAIVIVVLTFVLGVVEYYNLQAKTKETQNKLQESKLSREKTVAQLSDVVESRKEEEQIGSEKDSVCIQSAAFTTDRRYLATWETPRCDQREGAGKGLFRLMDLWESKFTVVLQSHPRWITHVKSVAVNGGGTHQALLTHEGMIWHRRYDEQVQKFSPFTPLQTKQFQVQESRGILSFAESSNAELLASSGWDGEVTIWDAESRKPIIALASGQNRVWDVAFNTQNSNLFATAGADGSIKLWRLPSGKMLHTLSAHTKDVRRIAFSPDGRRLASASWDHSVRVWEPGEDGWGDRSLIRSSTLNGHTRAVNGVAFNRTGNMLASCASDGTIKLWRPSSIGWQLEKTLRGNKRSVRDIAFNPDGGSIASVSLDGMVLMWDIAKGETIHQLPGHTGAIWSVDYNSQGTQIATAGKDGSARVWDTHTGRMLNAFEDNDSSAINRALYTGSDSYLITAGDNGSMIWWNLEWGDETKPLDGSAKESIENIALSPSGEHIAAIGQRSSIMILNTVNGDASPEFLTTQAKPVSVFFSPHTNESFLLAVISDGSLQSWRFTLAGIEEMSTQPTVNISNLISFNEAGDRLATFDLDGKPVVYAFPQFDTLLNPERVRTSGATGIALSPGGQMLAAGYENEINVWRLETRSGFLVMKISSEAADHRWLSFSADGKKLYAIGKTGLVTIYPIQ